MEEGKLAGAWVVCEGGTWAVRLQCLREGGWVVYSFNNCKGKEEGGSSLAIKSNIAEANADSINKCYYVTSFESPNSATDLQTRHTTDWPTDPKTDDPNF